MTAETQRTENGVVENGGRVSSSSSGRRSSPPRRPEAEARFTTKQWLTLIALAFGNFCNGACISLQAPFFPKEAEKKGATAAEIGFIFGVFSLTQFVTAPFIGKLVSYVNPKYLLDAGFLTVAVSLVLFGTLDMVADSRTFIALAFAVRIVEGIGTAVWKTSCFTIIAAQFPDKVSTTFAVLQTFNGVGLIAGPLIGGALYDLGGYGLPFYVSGSMVFIDTVVIFVVLPVVESQKIPDKGNFLEFLLVPSTLIYFLSIFTTYNCLQFNAATLEPHLREFHLSGSLLGLILATTAIGYAIGSPFVGWLLDREYDSMTISFLGCLCTVISILLIGPAPFIPLNTNLVLVITALALLGLATAAKSGGAFTGTLQSTINRGFPSDLGTYGLVSSMVASSQSLGSFVGPSVGGVLLEEFGYRRASSCLLVLESVVIFLLLVSIFKNKICGSATSISFTEVCVVQMNSNNVGCEKFLAIDSVKQNDNLNCKIIGIESQKF